MDGAVLQLNTAEMDVKPLSALALLAPLALVLPAQLTPLTMAPVVVHLATYVPVESAVLSTDTAERPPITAVQAASLLSVSAPKRVVPGCT